MYMKTAIALGFSAMFSACQPTSGTVSVSAPAGCRSQITADIKDVDEQIAELKNKQARGYRTKNAPLKIANPLKVCASPIPFVSLCTPSPKIKSSLPSYAEYKASQRELVALQHQRKALLSQRKTCG